MNLACDRRFDELQDADFSVRGGKVKILEQNAKVTKELRNVRT